MANETKVGILAIIAIALLIWGYKYIKGQNILNAAQVFYVVYDNVDYLKESSPVIIDGFEIGVVTDLYRVDNDMGKIEVIFRIEKDIEIPPHTVAIITDQGFLGGKAIELTTDIPCSGKFPCPEDPKRLRGTTLSFLGSVLGDPDELGPYFEEVSSGVKVILDTLKKDFEEGDTTGIAKSLKDVQETIASLKEASNTLNNLLAATSGSFKSMARDMASITSNLEQNNEGITKIIDNAASFTDQMSNADLETTVNQANEALEKLTQTLVSADSAASAFKEMAQKLNNGEGAIGKMLTDEGLYDSFLDMSNQADSLMADFQNRPYRYMPLKSRKRVKRNDRKDAEEKAEQKN